MTSSPGKNRLIYLVCSVFTTAILFSAATSEAMPLQVYGQMGLGISLPYGTVIVPEDHEAEIETSQSFSLAAGASWMLFKNLGLQAYAGYKRIDLCISYSGTLYNEDYNYRLNFGEIGTGIIGYFSPFSRFSFFYEGGIYYSIALPGSSLFVDGIKASSDWEDDYETGNEPGAFAGIGAIIPAGGASGNVSLQIGLRYKIGILPVLEGESAMAYNNEKDSLHSMDISLYMGIVKSF